MAHRLRLEAAQQPLTGAAAALADTSVGALLTALQAQMQAAQAPAPPQPPPRNPAPGQGWDLPERRHFRFRMEDVAFD